MSPSNPKLSVFSLFQAHPVRFLHHFSAYARVVIEKKILKRLDRIDPAYQAWQREYEPARKPRARAGTRQSPQVAFYAPTGLKAEELRISLDSLESQTTDAWELLMEDAASQTTGAASSRPARLLTPPAGLRCAAGYTQAKWIIPMSAGAAYAPWLVERLAEIHESEAGMIYWDEDVADAQGRRSQPFFKPDWSPELWLSLDILHQAAYSRLALLNLPALHSSVRIIPALLGANPVVRHLPEVLSHLPMPVWKNIAHLAAHQADARAWLAAQTGLEEAQIQLETNPGSAVVRPSWPLRSETVSVIIPTRDHYLDLKRCLHTILSLTPSPAFEIILIDNQSSQPEVLAYYDELRGSGAPIQIIDYPQPFNINTAWNMGVKRATGSLLLFLNNDTAVLHASWLEELTRLVQLPGVGICGARLEYPDGSIQHLGIVLGMTGHANHLWINETAPEDTPIGPATALRNVSAVTGACLMIRRDVFDKIGGFNEDYQLVFSDVEICLRARAAGYRTVVSPFARLIHFEGRSRSRHIPQADIDKGTLDFLVPIERGDPYYSPNLSLAQTKPVCRRRLEMPAAKRLKIIDEYNQFVSQTK